MISALMVLLCACGESTTENLPVADMSSAEENAETEAAKPMIKYDSIEEINSIVGSNIVSAAALDEKFYVVDGVMAEYGFSLGNVDYVFRASKTQDDITDVYVDGHGFFEDCYGIPSDGSILHDAGTVDGAPLYAARWFDGEMQYCLVGKDKGGSEYRDFELVLIKLSRPFFPDSVAYEEICGTYEDKMYSMVFTVNYAGNSVDMTVISQWKDDPTTSSIWCISASFNEDNSLLPYQAGYRGMVENYNLPHDAVIKAYQELDAGYIKFTDGVLGWSEYAVIGNRIGK